MHSVRTGRFFVATKYYNWFLRFRFRLTKTGNSGVNEQQWTNFGFRWLINERFFSFQPFYQTICAYCVPVTKVKSGKLFWTTISVEKKSPDIFSQIWNNAIGDGNIHLTKSKKLSYAKCVCNLLLFFLRKHPYLNSWWMSEAGFLCAPYCDANEHNFCKFLCSFGLCSVRSESTISESNYHWAPTTDLFVVAEGSRRNKSTSQNK